MKTVEGVQRCGPAAFKRKNEMKGGKKVQYERRNYGKRYTSWSVLLHRGDSRFTRHGADLKLGGGFVAAEQTILPRRDEQLLPDCVFKSKWFHKHQKA